MCSNTNRVSFASSSRLRIAERFTAAVKLKHSTRERSPRVNVSRPMRKIGAAVRSREPLDRTGTKNPL